MRFHPTSPPPAASTQAWIKRTWGQAFLLFKPPSLVYLVMEGRELTEQNKSTNKEERQAFQPVVARKSNVTKLAEQNTLTWTVPSLFSDAGEEAQAPSLRGSEP